MATRNEQAAITSHLDSLAVDEDIEIIAARDYGSRAQDLDSSESDYDVFFVYTEPPVEHALDNESDTMERTIDSETSRLNREIELHGWEFKKFIGSDGLSGSNPTAMDFVASDEEYVVPSGALTAPFYRLMDHTRNNYKPYALINHLRSMAAGNYGKYVEQRWIREWSQDEFQEYAGTPGGQTNVNEERGVLTIGILGYDEHTVEIPLDEAKAEDMIRKTTVDQTIKRYVNIMHALLRARYVEETHTLPPLDMDALQAWARSQDWYDENAAGRFDDLIDEKRSGNGDREARMETLDEWIESELERDVEPRELPSDDELMSMDRDDIDDYEPSFDHVSRQPDRGTIDSCARVIYSELYGVEPHHENDD
jgi:predicted nucleotidyltransferase